MLGTSEIMKMIPEKDPMLMVDKITEISDEEAKGYKNVTISEPHFRGHFPGKPIMPGVLITEAMVQLSKAVLSKRGNFELKGIDKLKFRRQVVPGDRLEVQTKLVSCEDNECKTEARAEVDGETACEGMLTFIKI